MQIPDDKEILVLHEKYAPTPEAFGLVYTHSVIVCEIAEQLLARGGLDIDGDLVRAGCLLHDIGVYRLYDPSGELDQANYVRHGVLGYELLREEGLPESVCRFASRHTGVGLTVEDVLAQGLRVPVADYSAETGEEKLVMYADKFHSKTDPPVFLRGDAYASRIRRFGEDKAAAFEAMRKLYGEPDLAVFTERHGHALSGG